MKHILPATLLGLLALVAAVFSLPRFSRADNVGLSLASDYDGQVITAGQTIQFSASLTNTDTVSRSYIFVAQVPTGTRFAAASASLQANPYPVGAAADPAVKSLTWSGLLAPQAGRAFTYALQISAAGPLPGGDIPVTALVFDAGAGQEIARRTITLDWPGAVIYLPLVLRAPASATPPPTATPLPVSGRFTPTIAGVLQSQSDSYGPALAGGGYLQGQDSLSGVTPDHYWSINLTLVQCRFANLVYMVHRAYLEFDTTNAGSFSNAYLVFRNNTAYPGPPAHSVNIHQGAWTQLLTATHQVQPAAWAAYGDLIASAPGNPEFLPVTATVTIPAAYINRGGITRFAFKSSTEGSAPQSYSCYGGADGLGASISLPYLYLTQGP